MARKYITRSKPYKCPTWVFSIIFNLAGINTLEENDRRQKFLLQLAVELVADYREKKTNNIKYGNNID